MAEKIILRDISWLAFNARVLQEAADKTVPLNERIRFLGIFSNNLDEFFRVRVATITRMAAFGRLPDLKMHLEKDPKKILETIQQIVLQQQTEFNRIWKSILLEMKKVNVFLKTEKELTANQKKFVRNYFETEVRSSIIPLMIESIAKFPILRDKAIYLGVRMSDSKKTDSHKYAIIEIPTRAVNRFINLPTGNNQTHIILLEDVIRYNLKYIFAHMDFDLYQAWLFKVTRDAEMDIDNDVNTTLIEKIEAGLKKRKSGKAVRLVYDKEMETSLLKYLFKRQPYISKENVIPGSRIHNFRDFIDFPDVFVNKKSNRKIFTHPAIKQSTRVTDVVLQQDVLLSFPYHSFDTLIDLLREAAMDDQVQKISITAYRLAANSKVMNALINAARNGKKVTVMLELKARFDEEANLNWKSKLEEEGVKVLIGIQQMKVHAKVCVITKKAGTAIKKYGFISTGNLNEKTAKVYADFCLLTANIKLMADVEKIFKHLEQSLGKEKKRLDCLTLLTCPHNLREELIKLINFEIAQAKQKKPAEIIIKVNSFSDEKLIHKIYEAAKHGVKVNLIIRGIFCLLSKKQSFKNIHAISIVDEYLEHARVFYFYHKGLEKTYISSADLMLRNLNHRIEATCPIIDKDIKKEILAILRLQLADNQKARQLNAALDNKYRTTISTKKIRSQIETFNYLSKNKAYH